MKYSATDAIADFLKEEGLRDTPQVARPGIAAAGSVAKAILNSPLLRDTFKAHGIQASKFSDYVDCTKLVQDSTWALALVLAPCKPEAYELTSKHLAPMAARTKVVDTILRLDDTLYGINTNVYAIQAAVKQLVGNKRPQTALIAGTSATARSVLVGLHELYPEAHIDVIGRTAGKTHAVLKVCNTAKAVQNIESGKYDLVVNATSVGVKNYDDRLDYSIEDTFEPGVRFFDVIIGRTYLQQTALDRGCSVISGAAMQYATNVFRAGLLGGK